MSNNPIKIFIGSVEASLLERKVLIYSLHRNSSRNLDIYILNGTHNTIERDGFLPESAPMSIKVKYQNVTEFSNYRFLIPEVCDQKGRAIYLDSDMIALGDIGELFDAEMHDQNFLAKPASYGDTEQAQWGLSVMLMDCSKTHFYLDQYYDEIDAGLYGYSDLHQMLPKFLSYHPFSIGSIDPRWNEFDFQLKDTKLIHYTNLYAQPWKYRAHPFGNIWFDYFEQARRAGFITDYDIELTLVRGFARKDLLDGNRWTTRDYLLRMARDLKAELKCIKSDLFKKGK
jgi:hypothetical protein